MSGNHNAHTYLFHKKNSILVATRELKEGLKSVYLGDLLFYFQAFFEHDMCICDDMMTVSRNHILHTYLFDNRDRNLVAPRELQKSVHIGDMFFYFFQALFKHDISICDALMTVPCNHSAHTYLFDNRNWILV